MECPISCRYSFFNFLLNRVVCIHHCSQVFKWIYLFKLLIFFSLMFILLLIYYQSSQMWLVHIVLLCETVSNVLMPFLFLQSFPSCLDIVLQAQVCIWNHFVRFSFRLVLFAATFAVWFMFFSYVHHHMNGSLIVSGSTVFHFLLFGLRNMIWIAVKSISIWHV